MSGGVAVAPECLEATVTRMDEKRAGRPTLPAGEARTEVLRLRIKPAGKARFDAAAQAAGIKPSEALRRAVSEWTTRNTP